MLIFALISVLLSSVSLFADDEPRQSTAEFSGQGMERAPADYTVLTITVRSECQPSPKDAQAAADAITKEIDDYLQPLKVAGDEHFKVLIDGGFSSPFSRWQRAHDGMRDVEVCRNTFQKTTTITLKMGTRDDFHQVYANIQDFVLEKYEQNPPVADAQNPRSYVSMSLPSPEITRDHRLTLERKAIGAAVQDAIANFRASIKRCEPHRWKVMSIKEGSDYSGPRPVARLYAKAAMVGGGAEEAESAAPVRFDSLEVSKSVHVTFQFEGALCYEN